MRIIYIYILQIYRYLFLTYVYIIIFVYMNYMYIFFYRRKFKSQTSDNMDRWKAEVVRVKEEKRREEKTREEKRREQKRREEKRREGKRSEGKGREEKRREEERRSKRESLRRKKIHLPEKVGKSQNTVLFQWFVAPEGRKVGSLKRRVRSPLRRWEMKSCTPLWHISKAKCTKKTPCSDHFWKLRCRKSARKHFSFGALLEVAMSKKIVRRCRAKHMSKSKCTKHCSFGLLLEVALSKKCTPLWREAHFEVKMWKILCCDMCEFPGFSWFFDIGSYLSMKEVFQNCIALQLQRVLLFENFQKFQPQLCSTHWRLRWVEIQWDLWKLF